MAARLMTVDEEPSPDMMLKSSMVIKNVETVETAVGILQEIVSL